MSIHTNYLTSILDLYVFRKNITKAKKALKAVNFDAFAVSGNSGTIMGGALALALKKKLILVRKPSDNSHSSYTVEGDDSVTSFMFLDDQISTGATRTRVVAAMKAWLPTVKFVGTYLYNYDGNLHVRKVAPKKVAVATKKAPAKKKAAPVKKPKPNPYAKKFKKTYSNTPINTGYYPL